MTTKQELYKVIQAYRALHCPKLNINSTKKELRIAVQRIKEKKNFKPDTKTKTKVKSKPIVKSNVKPVVKSKGVTQKDIDDLQKEIDDMREKAGRIAEREGRISAEVKKLLELINVKTRERLQLRRELKSKK